MPKGSWFFEGYQRQEYIKPNGRTASRLVYTGEWYGIDQSREKVKGLKLRLFLITLLGYAAYFHAQLFPSTGGMVHWLAIPSLLALVPMMWQVMGFANFLPSKEKWQLRIYYAGYRRLYRSGVLTLVLLAVWTLMELVYTLLHMDAVGGELRYLLEAVCSTGALALQLWLMVKNPATVVQGPTIA